MKKAIALALFFAQFIFQGVAHATGSSGFELATNSARALGRANAVTADPGEPAAVAVNPAGLTRLDGMQVGLSNTLLTFATDYTRERDGSHEKSGTLMSTVPAFFVSVPTPNKDLKLGAGVNAPFGLATQYSSTDNFKYTANYNEIKTIGYNLSAAYQVRNWLSVGLGFTYLDAYTKQVGKVNNSFLANGAAIPDSEFELDVSGSGYGMNFGFQVKPAEKHYVGAFYRTQVRTKQTGYISIDNIPGALAAAYNTAGTTFNTSADTDITFPGSFTLGYKYQWTPKWDIGADATWTQWSTFDRIDIAFDTTSTILQALEPVSEGFKNTLSLQLGTSYKIDDTWTVSGGYWFYRMAANKAYYSNAIPDANRHGVTAGIIYNRNNYSIGLSYAAVFFPSTSINNTVGAANGATVDGDYESFANILSMDAVYRF